MRPAPPHGSSPVARTRARRGRESKARLAKALWGVLETLETRQLLATLPMPVVSSAADISNSPTDGYETAPSIAVDPTNPNKMVAVYTRIGLNTPINGNPGQTATIVEGRYTTDGGANWAPLGGDLGNSNMDFTQDQGGGLRTWAAVTDASVGFDRQGNFYVLSSAHTATGGAGELLLQKFNFSGITPAQAIFSNPIYRWRQDPALSPTLAVDGNAASFTDPTTGAVQTDPYSGNVYVAWTTNNTAPANATNFNPNPIMIAASGDGGASFTTNQFVTDGRNFGEDRNALPRLAISQGGGGASGGQVSIVWADSGTNADDDLPTTRIMFDRITNGGVAATGSTTGGSITDATDPGGSPAPPHNVATTDFPITVTPGPGFVSVSDLDVELSLTHNNLSEVEISLIGPGGRTAILLRNRIDAAGATNANVGATGTVLGGVTTFTPPGGTAVIIQRQPTTFDQDAALSIFNTAGGNATQAHFRPDGGSLDVFNGLTAAEVAAGPWIIRVRDFRASNITAAPFPNLDGATIRATSGLTDNSDVAAATTVVMSAPAGAAAPLRPAASPDRGIGPNPVIAADNTLGSFSPHQGRLYLAYVNHTRILDANDADQNPADNTDIVLLASDNGGLGWSTQSGKVNDDNAQRDGFSEAASVSGRPQFQPEVAVDQTTGTLVMSWFDTRDDAARARSATYVTTSNDGGQTFSPQTFLNLPDSARDAITGQTVVRGPLPTNQSSGNSTTRSPVGYGDHQALAAAGGRIVGLWADNFNGGQDGKFRLDITAGRATFAAGPRVASSTMGPVDSGIFTRAADGTPETRGFDVSYDRPVDPATFTAGLIRVFYRDTTVGGTPVDITAALGPLQITPAVGLPQGVTNFSVRWPNAPSALVSRLGTYSYTIAPGVRDRIRTETSIGNFVDQNSNTSAGETAGDAWTIPVANDPAHTLPLIVPGAHVTNFAAHVAGAGPGFGTSQLVLNGTADGFDVEFDRDMNPSSFTAAGVLRVQGPAGVVPGPYVVTPIGGSLRQFRISFPMARSSVNQMRFNGGDTALAPDGLQDLSGTYTVKFGPGVTDARGNALDEDRNAGLEILRTSLSGLTPTAGTTTVTYSSGTVTAIPDATDDGAGTITPGELTATIDVPDDFFVRGVTVQFDITSFNNPDLIATLYAPDNTPVRLFTNVGADGSRNFTQTILDDNVLPLTPIQNGGAPFNSRFNPEQSLANALVSGHPGGPVNAKGQWRLVIQDVNPGPTGSNTLNRWALTFTKAVPVSGLGEAVSDEASASFRIFTMDPTNRLAGSNWTAVGPAALDGGGRSSRIGGLAVDPSDPSGNTVYVGGASGGVWKTTNFLDPSPTYIPLTDAGATDSLNIGGIAVFGRNNDPNQSIIFAATGEGDTGTRGVGFLRSMDGGATWTLLDSTDNTLPFTAPQGQPQRDHIFARGTSAFKVVVDPRPTSSGDVIVYAALAGTQGGIWRSSDTGLHWEKMLAGQATDVVLDQASGTGSIDSTGNPSGNLQIVYAAIRGVGVYISNNQGRVFTQMLGGIGKPLIQDGEIPGPVPVATGPTPIGANGRIVLAKPEAPDPTNAAQRLLYQGWLYAVVVTPNDHMEGLYVTKDYGFNWTKVHVPTMPPLPAVGGGAPSVRAVPSNNPLLNDYDVGGGGLFAQGNYDISLGVNPVNPNVIYIGGTRDGQPSGLIRVDLTSVGDAQAFVPYNNQAPDGGKLRADTNTATGQIAPPLSVRDTKLGVSPQPMYNLLRNPFAPFGNATYFVGNATRFNNAGAVAKWIPFDMGVTDEHRMVTVRDPLTGKGRVIIGDDQGVFSYVDDDGSFLTNVGTASVAGGARNGNLQINQFYYGAVQPSARDLNGNIHSALFFGSLQDNGGPDSNGNVLNNGVIGWGGPGGDAAGVDVDPQGSGTLYQYWWPCCGGNTTDFFQVNGTGRTTGLIQDQNPGPNGPDPQWPFLGGFNFAVNPLTGQQVIMGSAAGRFFKTENQGVTWFPIAEPGDLDGTIITAPAYGAPDPNGPGGTDNVGDFLYAGTAGGRIYLTETGGGTAGSGAWRNISAGLSGGTVGAIATNPTRGSHEAWAVTSGGVFYNPDTTAVDAQGAQLNPWVNITSNLFGLTRTLFQGVSDPTSPVLVDQAIRSLADIVADFRYVIPTTYTDGQGVVRSIKAPLLYVGGNGGIARSADNGKTWTLFTDTPENAYRPFGMLPAANFTDIDLSIGRINPQTGRAQIEPGDPNILAAFSYGRGTFAIRLAPLVFNTPQSPLRLDPQKPTGSPDSPGPGRGSDTGNTPADRLDTITNITTPYIKGVSQQSAFGNRVRITLYNYDDESYPIYIGGYDGTGATDTAANLTDALGVFSVRVSVPLAGGERVPHRIGVQATDQSGTRGAIVPLDIIVDTSPPTAPVGPGLDVSTDSGVAIGGVALAVSESDPNLVRPGIDRYTPSAFDVGKVVQITGGTGWTVGAYTITAVEGNAWRLSASPAAVGTTGGAWTLDTGERADDVTNYNNSAGNAPLFDLDGIEDKASVQLFRAPVVSGVPGTPVLVNTLFDVTPGPGGRIQIADTNAGAGTIADGVYVYTAKQFDVAGNEGALTGGLTVTIETVKPVSDAPDMTDETDTGRPRTPDLVQRDKDDITFTVTPDFQGTGEPFAYVELFVNGLPAGSIRADAAGSYLITATVALTEGTNNITVRQTDTVGNVGAQSAPLVVTLDTTPPGGINPDMTDDSDTGFSNTDDYTGDNTPTFVNRLVGGQPELAEPFALVQIYAQKKVADGDPPAPTILVGEALADAAGMYSVTVGQYVQPIDPPPTIPNLADGTYEITAIQLDIAGNPGRKLAFGAPGTVIIDGTDANDHGQFNTTTNKNEDGWLYIEKALNNIGPNVQNGNKVLLVLGAAATLGNFDAGAAIRSAFDFSILPAAGWSIVHVDGASTIDQFLSGQPVTGQRRQGNTIVNVPNVRLADAGILYITSANEASDDLTTAELKEVNKHGAEIAQFVQGGGGLFSHAEDTFDPAVPAYGWLLSIFPTIIVREEAGFGGAIEITTAGQAAFPGLTPADLSTGPWHNWFDGDLGLLSVLATDLNFNDVRVPLILTSIGVQVTPLTITIDTTNPVDPNAPDLQALSDSPPPGAPGYVPGISDTDNYTSVNNPTFDVPNVEPGATLELYRDGVLVNTLNNVTPTGVNRVVAIQDPGPVPAGSHDYTARQRDKGGNPSDFTGALTVVFDYDLPAAPLVPDLQALSDSPQPAAPGYVAGVTDIDNYTNVTAPIFDIAGVEPGATVQLLRNGVVVQAIIDAVPSGPNNIVSIQDPSATPDGTYTYTARQFDAAGNSSPIVGALAVTIDTAVPVASADPDLQAASDSGLSDTDNVTSETQPVFDVTTAEPDATVQLLRKRATDPASAYVVVQEHTGPGAIQDPGPVPGGVYDYATRQVDRAGNIGPRSGALRVTIDTNVPNKPDTPDLDPDSDTGISNADNITRITLFAFPVFNVSGVEPTATVFLVRDGTVVKSRVGAGPITDPVPVADGPHAYAIFQRDLAGNDGPLSDSLIVVIDTAAPIPPAAPDLQAASDTGTSATDNVTGVTNPVFDVAGPEAGATLVLLRDGQEVARLDGVTPDGNGVVAIQDPGPAPFGTHVYTAFQIDQAGNQGPIGGALTVTIDNSLPQAPGAPDLQAASDTGLSNIDNVTRATNPVFDIFPADFNTRVELFRDGNFVAFRIGPGPITDPGDAPGNVVPDGVHVYTARQVSIAGAPGPFSAGLSVTVDTAAATPNSPDLTDASDTGSSNSDNLTSDTTPSFNLTGIEPTATAQLVRDGVSFTGAGQTIPDAPAGAATSTITVPVDGGALKVAGLRVRLDVSHGRDSDLTAVLVAPDGTRVTLFSGVGGTGANFTGTILDDAAATPIAAGVAPFAGSYRPSQALAGLIGRNIQGNWTLELTDTAAGGGSGNRLNSWGLDLAVMLTRTGPGPVTEPLPLPDGVYTYTARQLDLAGNLSTASTPLVVTIASTRPPGPGGAPDLQPGSDSGTSNTDNITRNTSLTFDVTGIVAGNTAQLLRKPSGAADSLFFVAGSRIGDGSITDPGPLADGDYDYAVRQVDAAGNQSPYGPIVRVTIDTTAPNTPGTPLFQTGGASPTFLVTPADANSTVVLLRRDAGSTGAFTEVASRLGPGAIQDPGPVPIGRYEYAALARDTAGNQSATSPAATVDTTPPQATAAPDLASASDSGASNTDNITNAATLDFTIGGIVAGNTVELLRRPAGQITAPFVAVASKVGTSATVTITDGTLAAIVPEGRYEYAARQIAAGSGIPGPVSAATLVVTVDRTAPRTPGLVLMATDDTGLPNDGKTSVRRPRFTGVTEEGATVELLDGATPLGSASAGPGGFVTIQPAAALLNGAYAFRARVRDAAGNEATMPEAQATALRLVSTDGDFDADGRTDLALYRPESGTFLVRFSAGSAMAQAIGAPGDIPLRGDWDGDGKADVAVFRPSTSTFIINRSTAGPLVQQFGEPGVDIPVEADFDGDGRADFATYKPTTSTFYMRFSNGGARVFQFGAANDIPMSADFDGDGKTDIAVFDPPTGYWFLNYSGGGARAVVFGVRGDAPIPGDFDGDGRADLAVYHPPAGAVIIAPSTGGPWRVLYYTPNATPLLGDYDGDGKADPGVFAPNSALWTISQSRLGPSVQPFGWPLHDKALPTPLDYRRNRNAGTVVTTGGYSTLTAAAAPAATAAATAATTTGPRVVTTQAVAPSGPAALGRALRNRLHHFRRHRHG